MNLWFTFFVLFTWCASRFGSHYLSLANRLTDWVTKPLLNRTDMIRRHLKCWLLGVKNWNFNFLVFLSSLLLFVRVHSFQDLLWNRVDNLSLFVWFLFMFFYHRFATDLVYMMRFLFRMAFVCVTAIGFDFWGCLKHMDHRYILFFCFSFIL